jgi:hypothetical protein
MSLIVSENANVNNESLNYEKKFPISHHNDNKNAFNFNLNLDSINDFQQNVSKRNSTHVPLENNNKKTKLTLNEQSNEINSSSLADTTVVITENYSILKIKCKCIHILNRLICLVN